MATVTTTAARTAGRREVPERTVHTISPRVDIYETDKAFVLLAELANYQRVFTLTEDLEPRKIPVRTE